MRCRSSLSLSLSLPIQGPFIPTRAHLPITPAAPPKARYLVHAPQIIPPRIKYIMTGGIPPSCRSLAIRTRPGMMQVSKYASKQLVAAGIDRREALDDDDDGRSGDHPSHLRLALLRRRHSSSFLASRWDERLGQGGPSRCHGSCRTRKKKARWKVIWPCLLWWLGRFAC